MGRLCPPTPKHPFWLILLFDPPARLCFPPGQDSRTAHPRWNSVSGFAELVWSRRISLATECCFYHRLFLPQKCVAPVSHFTLYTRIETFQSFAPHLLFLECLPPKVVYSTFFKNHPASTRNPFAINSCVLAPRAFRPPVFFFFFFRAGPHHRFHAPAANCPRSYFLFGLTHGDCTVCTCSRSGRRGLTSAASFLSFHLLDLPDVLSLERFPRLLGSNICPVVFFSPPYLPDPTLVSLPKEGLVFSSVFLSFMKTFLCPYSHGLRTSPPHTRPPALFLVPSHPNVLANRSCFFELVGGLSIVRTVHLFPLKDTWTLLLRAFSFSYTACLCSRVFPNSPLYILR